MTFLLLFGRGVAFMSEHLWPAVVLGFLAVVVAPAIWSRRRDRQRAAMAVTRVILQVVTAVVVTHRARYLRQDVFADLLPHAGDDHHQDRPADPEDRHDHP